MFQSFEWGNVYSGSGIRPIRIFAEKEGSISGAVQILHFKLPFLPGFYYAPRGPVLDWKDENVFETMMGAVVQRAKKDGAIFLQIDPGVPAGDLHADALLRKHLFRKMHRPGIFRLTQPGTVVRLDLKRPLDDIFSSFRTKTRQYIRLSQKSGVTIRQGNEADLPVLHRLYRETGLRKGFPTRSLRFIKTIWKCFAPEGKSFLYIAEYDKIPLAAYLILTFGKRAWGLYAGMSGEKERLRASYALLWNVFQDMKEKGCEWYDFRGIPKLDLNPDNPAYGIYFFKMGFHPAPVQFVGEWHYVLREPAFKVFCSMEDKMQGVGKRAVTVMQRFLSARAKTSHDR